MRRLRGLWVPFERTRWNMATYTIAMAIGVTGAHFVLTPIVGVPEPAGFIAALAVVMTTWVVFFRRPAASEEWPREDA